MTRIRSCLALAFVLLSPTAANALLIEGLCDGTADGAVTCDTDTGLEWLDVTETQGLSANQFLADAGGWISAGWSMATGEQVEVVLIAAGAITFNANLPEQIPAVQLMLDLFGATGFNRGSGWAISTTRVDKVVRPQYEIRPVGGFILGGSSCCGNYTAVVRDRGVWAYREGALPVSEPNTLALFGLTLAGLGMSRRKTT